MDSGIAAQVIGPIPGLPGQHGWLLTPRGGIVEARHVELVPPGELPLYAEGRSGAAALAGELLLYAEGRSGAAALAGVPVLPGALLL
jgi:hypothetical protein